MAANRFIPINLRLPQTLLNESDQLAKQDGRSRSELVRSALRAYIDRRRQLQAAYILVERRGKEAGINTEADVEGALGAIRTKNRERS